MKRRRYNLGLAGLGMELAAAVIGFTLLGLWIDRRFETAPWAVVICASIGFVGGMYNFILSAQKAARKDEARRSGAPNTEDPKTEDPKTGDPRTAAPRSEGPAAGRPPVGDGRPPPGDGKGGS